MGIFSLIMGIPGLISGVFGTINGLTAAISNQKIAVINAATEEERIHAQERVNTLQSRRDVLIAEAGSGSRINLIMRSCFAVAALIVVIKLYVWDKVIGSLVGCSQAAHGTCGAFTTDTIDDNGWKIITMVMGFYFISEVSLGVTRIWKSK
jgi:hypothetical protein